MAIEIRPERPEDAAAIDAVNSLAFGSMDEANIVRYQRERGPLFDPALSLCAWEGGRMVGYTLWTPARLRLLGKTVAALAVGPVAVIPESQRRGIGGQLLAHGHALGRRLGYAFAFLHGHPTYYPRYGYKPVHGFARVTIKVESLPQPTRKFRVLPVQVADLPWLVSRHEAELAEVDFGWLWGASLDEWSFPPLNARMWWTPEGRRAAYTVAPPGKNRCTLLLAEDPALAREVLATIRPKILDHHPSGWLAREALDPAWATASATRTDPAMAIELQPGSLAAYVRAVDSGERPVGATLFPLGFLAC